MSGTRTIAQGTARAVLSTIYDLTSCMCKAITCQEGCASNSLRVIIILGGTILTIVTSPAVGIAIADAVNGAMEDDEINSTLAGLVSKGVGIISGALYASSGYYGTKFAWFVGKSIHSVFSGSNSQPADGNQANNIELTQQSPSPQQMA